MFLDILIFFFSYSINNMAAGKIFNATASRRSRRRRASTFRKSVAKIAKNVVMRQSETRVGDISYVGAFGTNAYFRGIFTNITRGDAQVNRDGDVIKSLGVRLRGYVLCDPSVITSNEDTYMFRMIVFSAKRPVTSLTDAAISWNGGLDPEKINVHYDALRTFKKDGRALSINKWITFKRNVLYEPSTDTVNKNELYFALIPYSAYGSQLTASTGMYINWVVQPRWKDL